MPQREKAFVAIAVTWAAGFVDTTGFLYLSDILAANMSGNTVRTGLAVADHRWGELVLRGWPILMFVAGLVVSAMILEAAARSGFRSGTSATLGLEAACLATFIGFGRHYVIAGQLHAPDTMFMLLVALLALAMGLQNATVTKVGSLSVKTTHVTGSLTEFAASLAEYLFWLHDRLRGRMRVRWAKVLRLSASQRSVQRGSLMLSLWIAFVTGAVCAAVAQHSLGVWGLLFPIAAVAIVIVIDIRRPVEASEEYQDERKAA